MQLQSDIFRQPSFSEKTKGFTKGEKEINIKDNAAVNDWATNKGKIGNFDDGKTANDRKRLTNKSSLEIGVKDQNEKEQMWDDLTKNQYNKKSMNKDNNMDEESRKKDALYSDILGDGKTYQGSRAKKVEIKQGE